MNKSVFILFLFFFSTTTYGQEKRIFETIKNNSFSFIKEIKKGHISNIFDLKKSSNYTKFKQKITNIDFKGDSIFTAPYFIIKKDNEYQITIFSLRILRKKENFQRATYFFVIKINTKTKNNIIEYFVENIYTDEAEFETWWLSRYKDYLKKTKIIHRKFGFVPPPPPPPPKNLK